MNFLENPFLGKIDLSWFGFMTTMYAQPSSLSKHREVYQCLPEWAQNNVFSVLAFEDRLHTIAYEIRKRRRQNLLDDREKANSRNARRREKARKKKASEEEEAAASESKD